MLNHITIMGRLTLCPDCHYQYDQTGERENLRAFFRVYLMSKYPGWDETKLIYRKEKDGI